jgi:dolichol-phosphate mannosyltransferase
MGFALLWACWGLLFFSLSHGKLPTYILPTLPALALLLGGYLDAVLASAAADRFFRGARDWLPRWTAAGLCCAWLAGGAWALSCDRVSPGEATAATAALLLALASLVALIGWGRRLSAAAAWGACAALAFAVLLGSTQGLVPAWAARRSPLARWDEVGGVALDARNGVALLGAEWSSVSFHLHGEGGSPAEVKWPWPRLEEFLNRHVRNLLIINDDAEEATVRRLLPPALAITRCVPSGHALIFVVEGGVERAHP